MVVSVSFSVIRYTTQKQLKFGEKLKNRRKNEILHHFRPNIPSVTNRQPIHARKVNGTKRINRDNA